MLERRQLLAVHTYTVPSGHSAVYLKPVSGHPGRIEVRLDTPTASVVTPHPFDNEDGLDIIDCGSNVEFLFVDSVPAAGKPGSDAQNDKGIMVRGGRNDTLRIDESDNDDNNRIALTASAATSGTIECTDNDGTTEYVGRTFYGAGVNATCN